MRGTWSGFFAAAATLLVASSPAGGGVQDGRTFRDERPRSSQTVAMTTEQGMFEIPGSLGAEGDIAARSVPGDASAVEPRSGTSLWSYDDEAAIADGVAIDDVEA